MASRLKILSLLSLFLLSILVAPISAFAAPDYYQVLGIEPSASAAEIKAAYRKLAMRYHPDRARASVAGKSLSAAEEAEVVQGMEAQFKQINTANEILSDPAKRQRYDNHRRSGTSSEFNSRASTSGSAGSTGFSQQTSMRPEDRFRGMEQERFEKLVFGMFDSQSRTADLEVTQRLAAMFFTDYALSPEQLEVVLKAGAKQTGMSVDRFLFSLIDDCLFDLMHRLKGTNLKLANSIFWATSRLSPESEYVALRKLRVKVRVMSWNPTRPKPLPGYVYGDVQLVESLTQRIDSLESTNRSLVAFVTEAKLKIFHCKAIFSRLVTPY